MADESEPLIEFPCDFAIKAMGLAGDEFEIRVISIVSKHAGALTEGCIRTRASGGGKYLSITVTIQATSRDQLDAIYQDLHDDPRVLMTL